MHQPEAPWPWPLPLVTNPHLDPTVDLLSLINWMAVVIHNMRQIPTNMVGQSNFYTLMGIGYQW